MQKMFRLPAGLIAISLAGCASVYETASGPLGKASLRSADGAEIGSVELTSSANRAMLAVTVSGISPGPHGFHLHAIGDCSAPDFKSADGHLNPLDKQHGTLNPMGSHVGDLANLIADDAGAANATYDLEIDANTLQKWLFDGDGTAVVIHAGPDDYLSDPAGAAGPRVACGEITR